MFRSTQLFDEGAKEGATLIFYSCRYEMVMQGFQPQVICHFWGVGGDGVAWKEGLELENLWVDPSSRV